MQWTRVVLFFSVPVAILDFETSQVRKRQLVSYCESSKFVLSFFLFCVSIFCLVMINNFLWLLSVFSLKKSVEVHFNKLKIFLLYFYDTYGISLWENTFGRRLFMLIHDYCLLMQNRFLYRISSFYEKRINTAED